MGRRPGADGARREPARMGRRRASRRRVVGRDVRRRDRAVRVVLDAMLAAQERARDLAINIVVEAALQARVDRSQRGAQLLVDARKPALRRGPGPKEPRLQFFRPSARGASAQQPRRTPAKSARTRPKSRRAARASEPVVVLAQQLEEERFNGRLGWRRHRRTQSSSSSTSLMSSRVKTPSVSWHATS